jgi:eukaryotic-like serine/threonine-protein kinase
MSSADELLERLASEYAERLRRGEQPALEEYQRQYPLLAEAIADLFPTVNDLEGLRIRRPEPKPAAAPRRFGEYHIVREIGRGGMGIVYLAMQPSLHRQVALKALPQELAPDEQARARFAREARLAARLTHPNIVPIHGVGVTDGTPWIAMHLVDGVSLDVLIRALRHGVEVDDDGRGYGSAVERIKAGMVGNEAKETPRADWHQRLAIEAVLQAADALRVAHEHGVLHRDVKPANLLVDRTGHVWLTDFGLATAGDEVHVTSASKITGTLQYVAPERFNGVTDERCDVYGLGLVLYELLALAPAFDQTSQAHLLRAVLDVGIPPPRTRIAGLSQPLEAVLVRACARKPDERYASAAAFMSDLRAVQAGQSPRPLPMRASLPWLIAIGAIAVVAIGVLSAREWLRKPPPLQQKPPESATTETKPPADERTGSVIDIRPEDPVPMSATTRPRLPPPRLPPPLHPRPGFPPPRSLPP